MLMVASDHMGRNGRALVGVSAAIVLAAVPLFAQGDRIILPRRPSPNQTLTIRLTQDMDMHITVLPANPSQGGEGQPPAVPPMNVVGTMSMEATQKVGERDNEGRIPSEFKYTDAGMNMKMNGMSVPAGDQFHDQFVGKTMTFAYGPDGTVTDVKVPDTVGSDALKASLQQAISSFTMSMPAKPLSIGESATVPFSAPIPMPLPGGGAPPQLKGSMTYTLVRIEGSGSNRVAVLDQKMEATAEGSLPSPGASDGSRGGAGGSGTGAAGPGVMMHVKGTGQLQMDLARGVARSGELQTMMDGTLKRPANGPMSLVGGDLHLEGTTKMKMSTNPAEDK
jgi:hypothetical protein